MTALTLLHPTPIPHTPSAATRSRPSGDGPPQATVAHPRALQVQRRPHTFYSLAARPEQQAVIERIDAEAYPAFMAHTDLADWWPVIFGTFPEYQLIMADARTGEHLAHGNLLPFAWDGTPAGLPCTAVEMVRRALGDRRRGVQPTALGALQAVVNPARQGAGFSARMLQAMAGLAASIQISDLFAPIRPTEKSRYRYPLASLESYVGQHRADGLPVDPWQRVHARLGAVPVSIEDAWLTVTGSLEEWAEWTGGMAPEDGPYTVPGGLVPVDVDRAAGIGRYVEPHLWMRYRIA